MKIAYSPNSPYVRKAMACAIKRGLTIEKWTIPSSDAQVVAHNPLAKVPTLVTDDGMALYDSPVICEYLDSQGSAPKLFPEAGPARWNALRLQALGDGIMDACQPRRREIALPQDAAVGLLDVARLPRGVDVVQGDEAVLHVHARAHLSARADQDADLPLTDAPE